MPKISQLDPAPILPLVGNEPFVVVQNGVTVKAPVDQIPINLSFQTIAALEAASPPAAEGSVYIEGYYASGDGGGHWRTRGAGSGQVTDAAGDTWIVVFNGQLNVLTVGAKPNSLDNNLSYINTGMSVINERGGGVLIIPPGTMYVSGGKITGYSGCSIIGSGIGVSIIEIPSGSTVNNNLIEYVSCVDFFVGNFSVNFNNCSVSSSYASISILNCSRFTASNCRLYKQTKFGISVNSSMYFKLSNNYIDFDSAQATQNQAIQLSSSISTSEHGSIDNNVCVNSGMNLRGSFIRVSKNNINGFGFGGGITTEQNSDSLFYIISENTIINSTGIDVNATIPMGIENWGKYSVISGNVIYNCSGTGIDNGGQYSSVYGNVAIDNSRYAPGLAGINTRYANSTYNGSSSTYGNNVSIDTLGLAGMQSYGYADQSSSVSKINLSGNSFWSNAMGAQNVISTQGTETGRTLFGQKTYDPASIPDGSSISTTVTISGANIGDFVSASFSLDIQGVDLSSWVSAANTVTVKFENNTGAPVDLNSGILRVSVLIPVNGSQL